MRVEYFINGFHQPQLSSALDGGVDYNGNRKYENDYKIPFIGQTDIQFLQSYKYICVDMLEDLNLSAMIKYYVYLEPECNLAKEMFFKQYGNQYMHQGGTITLQDPYRKLYKIVNHDPGK